MRRHTATIELGIIMLVLITLGMLSTVMPSIAAGKDRIFAGFHGYSADYVGYVSYIKEGMYGHYAMSFRSFPPAQPATPIHLEYILAGLLLGPLGLEAPVIYHLMRILFGTLLILFSYRVFRTLFQSHQRALFATIIAFTSSCIGWFSKTGGHWHIEILNFFPFSLSTPQRVVDRPHYLLGSVLFLFAFMKILQHKSSTKILITVSVVSFLTIMVHVASGIVLAMLSFVLIAISLLPRVSKEDKRVYVQQGISIFVGAAIASALSYYFIHQYSLVSDIFLDKYTYSTAFTAASIWREILSFGPLLWLGFPGLVLGLWTDTRAPVTQRILLLAWGCIHIALFFFLYPLFHVDQVRFVQSLYYLPLAYGTIILLRSALGRLRPVFFYGAVLLLLLLAFPTYIAHLDHDLHDMTDYQTFAPFGFPTQNQYYAYKFLDAHTPQESIVLAQYDGANMILLYSHNRVLGNDQGWTPQGGAQMQKEVAIFLSGSLTLQQAYMYLRKNDIRYIYYGYREKAYGTITHYPFLRAIYTNSEVTIYAVEGI